MEPILDTAEVARYLRRLLVGVIVGKPNAVILLKDHSNEVTHNDWILGPSISALPNLYQSIFLL